MTKPFDYQLKAIEQINKFNGRALLSLEMGLGKSAISLWWTKENDAWPMIVVCPASVKWVWQHEAAIHLGMQCEILEGRKPPRYRPAWVDRRKIIVINYDILKDWVKFLRKIKAKIIVGDEIHLIKEPRT